MDLYDAIDGRRSIRRFLDREVPSDMVETAIRCATMAPSAHNRQPWEFVVTRNADKKRILSKRSYASHLEKAPVAIVACARVPLHNSKKGERMRLLALQDVSAAVQNLLLALHGFGLGACWIGDFDEDTIRHAFNVPSDRIPVAIVAVGWPAASPPKPARKPLEEVVCWESYE